MPSGTRRTITITGRGAERHLPAYSSRRRPQRPIHERPGFKPDRTAMWAVMLGVVLVLAAATSSHAATLRQLTRAYQGRPAPAAHAVLAPSRASHR